MNLFPADRLRPKWADLLVLVLLLAGAAALALALRPPPGNGLTAVVTLDGVEVARQDLQALKEAFTLDVPGSKYPISIGFQPGQAHVAHTDCPGGDCARTGRISRVGGQIVCLPNRLVVALVGEGVPDVDAIVG